MIYKAISFLFMFFSPAVVDEIAKRIVRKNRDNDGYVSAGVESWDFGNLRIVWWSDNVTIRISNGYSSSVVRDSNAGEFVRGLWLFRLWWAL